MAYKAGTVNDFSNSMAQAIESAMRAEWPHVMGTGSPDSNPQFKLLCVAVAQGVVKHLRENAPTSIQVKVDLPGLGEFDAEVTLLTAGTLY